MSLEPYVLHLDRLIRQGRELRDGLATTSPVGSPHPEMRVWQHDCAALVNQLSGGSKAHWLAREYSNAFLVRSPAGALVEEAHVAVIAERILTVLEQAKTSLSTVIGQRSSVSQESAIGRHHFEDRGSTAGDRRLPDAAPQTRRFGFVHNAQLRPILEQAYLNSRNALAQGQFGLAFITSCSVLEAVLTDALEHESGAVNVAEWPFEMRIAAAERKGLIRGACARLPPAARAYRELANTDGALRPDVTISEREARLASQVLQVVIKDLDPGR